MQRGSVRFPVKTGVGAATQLFGASLAFFPSCAAIAIGLASIPLGHPFLGIIPILVGAILLIGGRAFAIDFFADMPVDGTLGADGVTLEGPSKTRGTVPWDLLAVGELKVASGDSVDRYDVTIPCRGGAPLTITATIDESTAMVNFLNMLRAKAGLDPLDVETYWALAKSYAEPPKKKEKENEPDAPAPKTAGAAILQCTACGAPLVPAETEHVACPHCKADNAVPEEVRSRVVAARQRRDALRARETALATFGRQPSARTMRLACLAFGGAVAVAWLTGIGAWILVAAHGRLHAAPAFELVWFALGSSLAGYSFLRALVASRASSMLAGIEMAASAPTSARREPGCRACGAPLAAGADDAVAVCGYCGTANALLFLVPRSSVVDEVREIESALEGRRFDLGLFAVMALVVGVPSLVSALYAFAAAMHGPS